jgi:hypothetical protein
VQVTLRCSGHGCDGYGYSAQLCHTATDCQPVTTVCGYSQVFLQVSLFFPFDLCHCRRCAKVLCGPIVAHTMLLPLIPFLLITVAHHMHHMASAPPLLVPLYSFPSSSPGPPLLSLITSSAHRNNLPCTIYPLRLPMEHLYPFHHKLSIPWTLDQSS